MKVMYAVDGSVASDAAAQLLEVLSNRAELEVSVVSVAEAEPVVPGREEELGPVRVREATGRAREIVDRSVQRLRSAGFAAEGQVIHGRPGSALLEATKDLQADLVLLGAGRHSWLGNMLLGRTSTQVLKLSRTSILIVHGTCKPGEALRVLVATDGSPSAQRAIELFAQLADPDRCQIGVLSVAQNPQVPALDYAGASGGETESSGVGESSGVQERIEQATRRADDAAATLRDAGFNVDTIVRQGSAHHMVLEEADKGDYPLVVVGSKGNGAVQSPLGSVSESVVRHANAALVGRIS